MMFVSMYYFYVDHSANKWADFRVSRPVAVLSFLNYHSTGVIWIASYFAMHYSITVRRHEISEALASISISISHKCGIVFAVTIRKDSQ